MKINNKNIQGNVLVTGLIFVMVLTVLGVGSMQSSSLEYRMSTNTAFKKQAFEFSESGRSSVTQVIDSHIFGRGWTGVNTANGLAVLDKDNTGGSDLIYINESGESVTSPVEDAEFYIDENGNTTYEVTEKVAGVSVFLAKDDVAKGNSAGAANGYSGAGKGIGNGGFHMFFQVQSDGTGNSNSRSSISTDFRYVAR